MKLVDMRIGPAERRLLLERFRFMTVEHTDFILDGFRSETLDQVFDDA
jgi:hypothetical protein